MRIDGLQPFGPDIWTADGPLARDAGLTFTTRMTIVRLADGSLWVESPVSLSDETLNEIRTLGDVGYIVSSTQRHNWRLGAWHTLFPQARVAAPGKTSLDFGGSRIAVDDVLTDTPHRGWVEDLDQLVLRGNPFLKEVSFLHRKSRTVILGDIIQANPVMEGRSIRNLAFRLLNVAAPHGGVSRDLKFSFIQRSRARESLRRLLAWDFDKLIISHGDCVPSDAKAYVKDAFGWLEK